MYGVISNMIIIGDLKQNVGIFRFKKKKKKPNPRNLLDFLAYMIKNLLFMV